MGSPFCPFWDLEVVRRAVDRSPLLRGTQLLKARGAEEDALARVRDELIVHRVGISARSSLPLKFRGTYLAVVLRITSLKHEPAGAFRGGVGGARPWQSDDLFREGIVTAPSGFLILV